MPISQISRGVRCVALLATLLLVLAHAASAQVGSTTGAIIGSVTDNTKAVMPGVTINVTGPALMSPRSVVTGVDGDYRIPTLPPGVYTLVFELPGFATVTREGIRITVGFTATVNTEMSPAGVAENVTVSGSSPVVDLSSTKVTTEFGAEKLANLSGTRDYAAVTAQVPGVSMTRPSVGSAGAITFQRSTRYGISGQDRGEVEGIVTTEAAAGGQEIGYSDSDSFEDMVLNVIGNTAAMPQPGTHTVVVSKSGGNTYRGRFYTDYQSESLEAVNIDQRQINLGIAVTGSALATTDLNRVKSFRDLSGDVGGYILKNRLWWYGAIRRQKLSQGNPVLIDSLHKLSLDVYTTKLIYNLSQNNKLSWYYSRGTKRQNGSIINSTVIVTLDALAQQKWPNGPWKVEYNSILGNTAVFEARFGNFFEKGIYDGRGSNTRYQDTVANRFYGTANTQRSDHERPQVNGSLTYFKDNWAGTHNFKFGGEVFKETDQGWQAVYNNQFLILNNGAPTQVQLYQPPPTERSPDTELAVGFYAQDTWRLNSRITLNLGFRVDRYKSYVEEQVGPTGQRFARNEAPAWTNPGPRLGVVYALTDDGKTLLKANYGQYWNFPYNDISGQLNPQPQQSSATYAWTPTNPRIVNGLPVYDPGQEGRLVSVSGANPDGSPSTTADPNLKNTYSRQAVGYFEREVADNFGVRAGFVWNAWRQLYGRVNPNTPYSAFNQPVTVQDPGPDGRVGTTDDGPNMQAFNLDPAYLALPLQQVIRNIPNEKSDFYTWEVTANKRQAGRWSLLASFSQTFSYQSPISAFGNTSTTLYTPNTFINTRDGRNQSKIWTGKISGSFDVGYGIRLSPAYRHQSGAPFGRTFTARLNYNTSVSILAEPFGNERLENINLIDLRSEKLINIKKARIGLFFDVYNIGNLNADQIVTTVSGSAYLRPSVITAPRIARFGFKFDF